MEFNSIVFLIFFIGVFFVYYLPAMRRAGRQNALLLIASYVFYGAWDWRFLFLIFLTTLSSFLTGIVLSERKSRLVLGLNIALNVGILVVFKYFNFFSENLRALLGLFGWSFDWVFIDVLLPVGISFYTFQAIGYSIDVYRGEISRADTRNPLLFFTFISYFPQLVAGPIEKAGNMFPQLSRARVWNYNDSVEGLRRILWGLVKKVVVADQCGFKVDAIWEKGLDGAGPAGIFLAVGLFTIQIYCDFSGYCDIALGTSRILGIRLMENFERPYFSRSVVEFWHRWHISLMKWFTAYIYIPLGGSRVSPARHYANIFTVFVVSGLWHGASWNFVVWGLYWGLIYTAAVMLKCPSYRGVGLTEAVRPYKTCMAMVFVVIGWAIFRSTELRECCELLAGSVVPLSVACGIAGYAVFRLLSRVRHLFVYCFALMAAATVLCLAAVPDMFINYYYLFVACFVFAAEWKSRASDFDMFPLPRHAVVRNSLYILLYVLILTAPSIATSFIYFQF